MIWVMAIVLALGCFGLAVVGFRIGKGLWTTLGAALTFGLVGYAWQASPDLPSAPKASGAQETANAYDIVAARREFIGDGERSRADALFTADAYAQRGRYSDAATILAGITSANPQDFEAWIAQGNALTEHAGGALTAPALFAYRNAAMLRPDHIAPAYFLGASLIRQGRLMEARQVWDEALQAAPESAEGKEGLRLRLERLETVLVGAEAAGAEQGGDRAE